MSELLLELFSEEIPARMQENAATAYKEIFIRYFTEQKIGFEEIEVYVGPRRLAVNVIGLPAYIEADQKEIRGPKTSAPDNAIFGFCQSNNITKELLSRREIKGVEYFVYEQSTDKQKTKDILKNTLHVPIGAYVWPKSMFWGDYKIKWVRPLRNILCIFDAEVIDMCFGHLKANNISFGHRFMSGSSLEVSNFDDYIQKLTANYVILDSSVRKKLIWEEAGKLAAAKGLVIKHDEELLDEVTGLVEYPQVMIGKIDEKFLAVPSEVLVSSMRTHQKYFSVFDKDGRFAPYFIFVANIKADNLKVIVEGNQKVLAARLSDALYFYNLDLKTTLEEKTQKLEKVIFHAKLGTVSDKIDRVSMIVKELLPDNEDVITAALYCKSDIVSEVVGEFPELQGIMGYHYAKHEGLNDDIAIAIRDHYKPIGANDTCPKGIAAYLAIADKVDTLCGLILAGEKPTGSKDPFALRRQALGIIRIILENKLPINLSVLTQTIYIYKSAGKHDLDYSKDIQIGEFIEERARHFFKNEYPAELVDAALNLRLELNLLDTKIKLDALLKFSANDAWPDLINVYKRANNIVGSSAEGKNSDGRVDKSLFENEYERDLFDFLCDNETKIKAEVKLKNYQKAFEILAQIRPLVERFFENVMVKVEDQTIANNRLNLLIKVKYIFNYIVNFDQL